ncbi:MAG: RNHCP domain-containing protein [Candidatus Absconditabacterales bacterium]|nr:RNHCP domain-containing protein [Candidatus Absconditabacterales bacterium]
MMQLIKNNQGFTCRHCGLAVPPAPKRSRNHCPSCFCSLHVDVIPGDRACTCVGHMVPVAYVYKTAGVRIEHACMICGHHQRIGQAEDDCVLNLDEQIATWTIMRVMS